MAVQWLLVCHGLVTLLVVVSFLCGQWPIFQGTFIQRIHFFITFGAHDYFRRFIHFACGSRGSDALLSVEYYCCDRPNPILQLIYFLIIGATYYFIATSFFIYITRVLFKWSAQVSAVVLCLLFALWISSKTMYYQEMFLNTCRLILMIIFYSQRKNVQLAKSQNLLDRSTVAYVIARFDHHYGWMNNCIGERNTRYFMAFILWHFIICVYGIVAPALILAGRLKDLKVIYILTNDYGIENSFRRLAPIVIQWLSNSYNTQILIMVFLAVVSLMLAVFSTYHAKLCITNTTTNESFKWHEYLSWQTKVNEAKVSAAALKASLDELNNERSPEESEWRIFVEDLVYRNWKW